MHEARLTHQILIYDGRRRKSAGMPVSDLDAPNHHYTCLPFILPANDGLYLRFPAYIFIMVGRYLRSCCARR